MALWPNFLISQYYSGWIFFSHFLLYLRTVLSRINNCIELTWARLTLSYRIDARLIFSLLRQYGSSPVVAVGYRSHCILIGMLTLGSYPEWHRTAGFFFSLSAIDLLKRVCDNLPADQHGFDKYRIFHAILVHHAWI